MASSISTVPASKRKLKWMDKCVSVKIKRLTGKKSGGHLTEEAINWFTSKGIDFPLSHSNLHWVIQFDEYMMYAFKYKKHAVEFKLKFG